MDLKRPFSINDQITKLRDHCIEISDVDNAKNILETISYYRLSGYMLQYRTSDNSSSMVSGITIEDIYAIYCFDEELRALLRLYIEKAEFYYKNVIGNEFARLKCKQTPYDQHYDSNSFYDKKGIASTLDNFCREKSYYKDSAIVKHHATKYGDKMPVWVMMELMTISSVSKFYHAMYQSDKEKIAQKVGTGFKALENHLHALSILRNKCSHGVRLYNTTINPPIRFSKSYLRNNPNVRNDSLFAYILMLSLRLPSSRDRAQLRNKLCRLLKKYDGNIDLNLIGFPINYKELLYIRNVKMLN